MQLGSEILEARLSLVAELRAPVQKAYADLAPTGGHAGLDYKASWCDGSPLDRVVSRDEIARDFYMHQTQSFVVSSTDPLHLFMSLKSLKAFAESID